MKRLKLISVICTLCAVVMLFGITPSHALGETPYFQANAQQVECGLFTPSMTTNPENMQYYLSTKSAFAPYITYVRAGIESWNSSTYHIDLDRTTSYSSSVVDVKGYYGGTAREYDYFGTLGYTVFIVGDGPYSGNNREVGNEIVSIKEDYWMAEIYINYDTNPSGSLNTTAMRNQVQHVAAHEMGHAFGLSHQLATSTHMVMCTPYNSNVTKTPYSSEQYSVQFLYNHKGY